MKKTIIEAKCTHLDSQAKGHIQYQRKDYAFNNLLPGETARFDFTDATHPQLLSIIEKSSDRIRPRCDQFDQCGGCQLMHMNEEAQQTFKTQQVIKAFQPLKNIMDTKIGDCMMADDPWYYRNKVQMPVTRTAKNALLIGFYKENSLEIIEKDDCFIQMEIARKTLKVIRELIKAYKVTPYDWQRRRGTLKYLLLRYGFSSQELMVVFVTNGPDFKFRKPFVAKLTKEIPQIKTIVQNVNLRKDHLVLDRQENIWYGKGYIQDTIGDIRFLISSKSFYQINPPQVKKLYDCVKDYAALTKKETVIDAYCGVGTIGLYLARDAKQVDGVEMIVSAIDDARKNARLNQIANARFQVGDASKYMQQLAKEKKHVDVVVVDPPRSGCTPELIESVKRLKPEKFIYVSCNIETQVRDLKLLNNSGYRIKKIQAFDLFPQTYHIETVVLLSKLKSDKHIDVEISVG